MSEKRPERDVIEQAEELILRIREIQSCRIVTDAKGLITEIHVVAVTDRPPKMIARDVETCLKAQMGLAVDYRKIGVVIIDTPEADDPRDAVGDPEPSGDESLGYLEDLVDQRLSDPAGDEDMSGDDAAEAVGTPGLEFLEEDIRIRFRGLSLTIDDTRVDVEVKLERNGIDVTGSLGAFRKSGPVYETIAGAAIHAISELLDETFHLCLSGIEEVELSGRKALVAAVELVEGRTVRSFSGSAFTGRDPNEAAVLAVLNAVNRPFGKWKSRREIHYRIR